MPATLENVMEGSPKFRTLRLIWGRLILAFFRLFLYFLYKSRYRILKSTNMREAVWLWLRGSTLLRKLYEFPLARKPMTALSYLLVPAQRKRLLRVRTGPGADLVFEMNPRWEIHLWEGDYELSVQQVLVDRLRPGSVFYDVGAGFGFYSSLGARLGARTFAFEPDEENAKAVLHHAKLNSLAPQIEVVPSAVLAASGITYFERALQDRGHGNGLVSESSTSTTTVNSTSLDDFVVRHPLPHLIKIDVEGAESEVLKGAEGLFGRCRPTVICEAHDASNSLFVSSWLERKGYFVKHLGNRNDYPNHLVAEPE
jgi:FkbM family methyltransferase